MCFRNPIFSTMYAGAISIFAISLKNFFNIGVNVIFQKKISELMSVFKENRSYCCFPFL